MRYGFDAAGDDFSSSAILRKTRTCFLIRDHLVSERRFRLVTQHFPTRQLRFFLTAPSPCPYLPDREERKVFAHLPMSEGPQVNDALTQVGFRRSQNIAYRPACEACDACVSARIPATNYPFSRSERRVLERNRDLVRHMVEAEATMEQFELLRRYLM